MSAEYYIELNDMSGRFEKVDQHVFENRKYAVSSDGEPRYTENYFAVENGVLTVELQTVKADRLGVICRILDLSIPTGSIAGGFYSEPTHVNFRKSRYEWLYDVQTGQRWKRAA